jgi:hypothetical protein
MAVQDEDEKDLQALAALLADIARQLTSENDQSELMQLRNLHQRCLLELALVQRSKHGKEG